MSMLTEPENGHKNIFLYPETSITKGWKNRESSSIPMEQQPLIKREGGKSDGGAI